MIIAEKCNCCVHEKICSFKQEYLNACEAVKNTSYTLGKCENGDVRFKFLKDSQLNIIIRCPHIMINTEVRGVNNE